MCFIKIRKGDSDAKVNSEERIHTMENTERKFIMSKRIKKVISLVLIFMIAMFQTLSTFAASGGGSKFEIVDSEYGIYRLNSSRERLATNADNSLIEDNGSYYICLQDGLYVNSYKGTSNINYRHFKLFVLSHTSLSESGDDCAPALYRYVG